NGIGESKAEAILAYRDERGGFQSVEELKKVSGIGDGIYAKLQEAVTVSR
ncbi:MAG: helix-hairpin-helix domain-containing protein, partial [Lachnospiraceae bacterium]|nr:helix-hairpin-helix domain-containing protein [Lachnospiraceae bacterium]